MWKKCRRYIPISLIFLLMILAYLALLANVIGWEDLKKVEQILSTYTFKYPLLVTFLFMSIYILYVVLALPGPFVLSILAGCLFPQPFSTLYVIISATIGASLLFLAARTSFREHFYRLAGPLLKKVEKGLQEDAASYLIFLRLVPFFPLWFTNTVPALFGIPYRTFLWTTVAGLLPGIFIFTEAGRALTTMLDDQGSLTVDRFFNLPLRLAMTGVAILFILPTITKKFKSRRRKQKETYQARYESQK
ncbi:TVP38/TMEM64 family protein [Candidatus Protochlamydia phocaeensis]|uniref:TVP38/TMEM64 family protein n=1 Tax=Candidatus Protochlamydia phocaeensis TaxID=1414722 RepID=UPI00083881CE|nr:VTT domain-containing protein [Candidatus Protochlamydia phocaeensis]